MRTLGRLLPAGRQDEVCAVLRRPALHVRKLLDPGQMPVQVKGNLRQIKAKPTLASSGGEILQPTEVHVKSLHQRDQETLICDVT